MEEGTVFLIIWLLFAVFIITTLYRRGKRALTIFPDISTVPVLYREKFASGHSTKSMLTKSGGARNALDIVVTDKELWLKSMVIFASIGQHSDLLHRVPLDAITRVSRNRNLVTIDFKRSNGESKQVVLTIKRPDAFLEAIKNHNKLSPTTE